MGFYDKPPSLPAVSDPYSYIGDGPLSPRRVANNLDVDLRAQLQDLLWNEGRGIYILYRKCQFENDVPRRCVCWKRSTQEQDIDTSCQICLGSGYFFDDYMIRSHKSNSQAFSDTKRYNDTGWEPYVYVHFYVPWDAVSFLTGNTLDISTTYDKLVEVEQDLNGVLTSPLKQLVKYDIISVDPYRLDIGGRIEYFRIRTRQSLEGTYLI